MTAAELIEQVKQRRRLEGLNVIVDGTKLFSFATPDARDDFMARAESAGHDVKIEA